MSQSTFRKVNIEEIPLIELNNDNIQKEWDNLTDSLKDSTFIALDLEMTGLGKREELNHSSIDERYRILKKVASSFSIFSLGISCFKIYSIESQKTMFVKNKSFNLALLCSDHFMVDPESIQFLIFNNHDISLNFSKGIKYYRGNDRKQDEIYRQYPRELFIEISNAKKPIILHNGLIDLVFLYQNFYAEAPENLMKFLADLREIFQGGIFDTKFISEFYGKYNCSYLEYLYLKTLFENSSHKRHFVIQFNESIQLADFEISDDTELSEKTICYQFYLHGNCQKLLKQQCHKNHDLKLIFNYYIRKENHISTKFDKCFHSEISNENQAKINEKNLTISHNAGIDAFMTGHVMLYLICKISNFEYLCILDMNDFNIHKLKNIDSLNFNINLSGKDFPLVIQKSKFNSISSQHKEKKKKLRLN